MGKDCMSIRIMALLQQIRFRLKTACGLKMNSKGKQEMSPRKNYNNLLLLIKEKFRINDNK